MTDRPSSMDSLLASAAPGAGDSLFSDIVPVLGWLVGLVVVGSVVIWVIRRRLADPGGDDPNGFTLHGLRELRKRGELSDEEFERARATIIASARRSADPEAAPEAGDRGRPSGSDRPDANGPRPS